MLIADHDGKGSDDIVCYNGSTQSFEVSVGGRTGWQHLAAGNIVQVGGGVFGGHFQGGKAAQVLGIGPADFPSPIAREGEQLRRGSIFSRASGAFTPYGINAY